MKSKPDSPTVNDPLMTQFAGLNFGFVFRQGIFSQIAPASFPVSKAQFPICRTLDLRADSFGASCKIDTGKRSVPTNSPVLLSCLDNFEMARREARELMRSLKMIKRQVPVPVAVFLPVVRLLWWLSEECGHNLPITISRLVRNDP